MLPSFSDLKYFLEVAASQKISRAAEKLGISQPSLTLAVRRLEDSVGALLFHRSKSGVKLTPAGQQLLVSARGLLQNWEHICASAAAATTEVQGSFSIGCHPSVALYTLPHFVPQLLDKNPKLNLQ